MLRKILLIPIGLLGVAYTVAAAGQLFMQFSAGPVSAMMLAASVVPVCLGLIVTLICFKYAFPKRSKDSESTK